ncbi:MAG: Fe-S cluster assembly protein IscX [Anaerolineae bacterium]
MDLYWDDAYQIARELMKAHPDVDPLSLNFVTLHKWITALPDFADDPQASTEGRLEAIQMEWYEECQAQ